MKYTVIGHFSIDIRHRPGETDGAKEQRSYAGIMNAVKAMASLAADTDTVYPVFGVGERDYFGVKTALAPYKNVDISGIYSARDESNEVHYYPNGSGTTACAKKISAPIPFSKIESFLNVNGVLINMISGSDITIDTLDEIRMVVRAKSTPVHLDLHNLTLGVNPDATRFRRPLPDWRRWCFMMNTIQMNEEEATGLTPEYPEIEHLVKQMVPLMVQALCVTRGEKGVVVYEAQHKSTTAHTIEGESAGKKAETVGCGDIFGAAFLQRYCTVKNFVDAARFANHAASESARVSGEDKYAAIAALKEPQ
jgi:sugar/nucleoside kinase (ribokinase family)